MNTTPPPYLTTTEAARRLNRSSEWVSQLVTAGRIEGHKVANRWRIDADSLEAYILERKRPGKQPKAPPLEPRPTGAYQYQGVVDLVMAVVELAAEEAVGGDLPAQLWIASSASDHWFHYVGIDPDAAREAIKRRARQNDEEGRIKQVIALHDEGLTWKAACMDVFGYYSEPLRYRVGRYHTALEELAAYAAGD